MPQQYSGDYNSSYSDNSSDLILVLRIMSTFLATLLLINFAATLPFGVALLIGFYSYEILAMAGFFIFDTSRMIYRDLNTILNRGSNFLNRHITNPYLKGFIAAITAIPFFLIALTGITLFNLTANTLRYAASIVLSIAIGVGVTLALTIGAIAYLVMPTTVSRMFPALLARAPAYNRIRAHEHNKSLADQINSLPAKSSFKNFAIDPEVRSEMMKLPDDHPHKANLLMLESMLEDEAICSITWNTIKEPLTVEFSEDRNTHSTLFEKSSLETHLSTTPSFAKLPGKEIPLTYNDKNKVWKREGDALTLRVDDVKAGHAPINRTIKIYRDLEPNLKNKLMPLIASYRQAEPAYKRRRAQENAMKVPHGQNPHGIFNELNRPQARGQAPLRNPALAPRRVIPPVLPPNAH
jgi:hypothetical protein